MNLIDPFEFRDRFAATRSLAVVGNAPCILDHENGALIDSHDLVVRFNRATTQGHEPRIGSRTDILVVNAANSLAMAPSPATTVRPRALVCFVSPQGAKAFDPSGFREWVGDLPVLLTFGPDLIGISPELHTRPLTSGTYVLFTLLRLLGVEKLFVTGFTMFGAVSGGSAKYYADARPGVGAFHDLDQESKLFAQILRAFPGVLHCTPEIDALVRIGGTKQPESRNGNGPITSRVPSVAQSFAGRLAWRFMRVSLALRRYSELP
jgi:hypothetical protein